MSKPSVDAMHMSPSSGTRRAVLRKEKGVNATNTVSQHSLELIDKCITPPPPLFDDVLLIT